MIDREHGAKVIAVACGAAVLTLGGLFLLSGGSGTGSAAGADTVTAEQGPVAYEDRDIPLFRAQLTQETIPIRFYDDMPNIAYVKIEDYHHIFLPEDQVTVEETADGTGVYNVANGSGSAVIDTVEETIESDDLFAFVNVMGMLQPGMPNAYLDGLAYCRWARREASPVQVPVELDLANYGIDLRADESGLYLPVATLSDLYADLAIRSGKKAWTVLSRSSARTAPGSRSCSCRQKKESTCTGWTALAHCWRTEAIRRSAQGITKRRCRKRCMTNTLRSETPASCWTELKPT